jgi:hypothetical protein
MAGILKQQVHRLVDLLEKGSLPLTLWPSCSFGDSEVTLPRLPAT